VTNTGSGFSSQGALEYSKCSESKEVIMYSWQTNE
jgi:hypothetical protein